MLSGGAPTQRIVRAVSRTALVLCVLLASTCATAPEREVDHLCGAQGRRFVAEAYGVGGLGLVEPAPLPSDEDPKATGGAREPYTVGGLTYGRQGEGTIGLGNLGPIGRGRVTLAKTPPPAEPEGLVLQEVTLGHGEVGRGGLVDGLARYASHRGAKVVLEATATVAGYGWKSDVSAGPYGRAGFWLACQGGRGRHVVDWTFRLRDGDGHHSEAITRPLACTDDPLPGRPPQLEEVRLDQSELVAGWSTHGWARASGTHPPFQLIARSRTPGYGWREPPRNGPLWFSVACRAERGIHSVLWEFSVRDSYGRESNVIRRSMNCGVCQ
jgi:hypothetical protein